MDWTFPIKSPFILEHPGDVLWWQFLMVRIIGFVLIAVIVMKFIVPMIGGMLGERQAAIVEATEQVQETMRETEQMRNDYRRRLEAIEDETQQRLAEAIREAGDLRERILEEAQLAAEALVRRGYDEVDHERAKAVIALRRQFAENIVGAAEYAAARALNEAQHRRLVDDFVQNVGVVS